MLIWKGEMNMHVYKINQFYIAAKNADSAFGEFMEHSDSMEDVFIGDLEEKEEETVEINVKRLSTKAMNTKNNPCCGDEGDYTCYRCDHAEDTVYISFQDMINDVEKSEHRSFPEVLCWDI